MSSQFNPLMWSIPAGTWGRTRVRVSVFLPLLVVVLCLQLPSWQHGLLAGLLLGISVLLHEVAHVWASRATGGEAETILLWPLGGLAPWQPAPTCRARLIAAAAGPIVNLVICLATLMSVWRAGLLPGAINPFDGLAVPPLDGGLLACLHASIVLLFTINWLLLLINLLPVHPFDGGRMAHAVFSEWFVEGTGTEVSVRLGAVTGLLLIVAGMLVDGPNLHGTWLVCLGAVILVLNLQKSADRRAVDDLEDALFEYELALEEIDEFDEPIETDPGLLERWRQRREDARVHREQELQQEVEQQVDELLEKVHLEGFEALTTVEKRQLRQASRQYRRRTTRSEEML